MITIDAEKSTTTDIHFLIKVEYPFIEDGDKELEFVTNQDNFNKCLDLFIKEYSPFSGWKEYYNEFLNANLESEMTMFDEKTERLTLDSAGISNLEEIINEQYRLWRKYNYE